MAFQTLGSCSSEGATGVSAQIVREKRADVLLAWKHSLVINVLYISAQVEVKEAASTVCMVKKYCQKHRLAPHVVCVREACTEVSAST